MKAPQDNLSILQELRATEVTQLTQKCADLRDMLIQSILQNGGHFSANLGTVELTVALHYCLNTPDDQLVWDVGHQAYLHKYLTGRAHNFESIRKHGGLSGFPSITESPFDAFGTGHSSTSISAVLGMAEADRIQGIDRQHVAIIGDGSLTGGMAWEAINNASVSQTNILIIINDNQMAIDRNEAGISRYLNGLQPKNFFTELGFDFYQSSDGHDVESLVATLKEIQTNPKPKVWHVRTVKGKGYPEAELEQTKWHAVKYVKVKQPNQVKGTKYQDVFGQTLVEMGRANTKIVGITPAMPTGSSMTWFMEEFPERFFDVGIAEQHAVTFAAGMAKNGLIPFCNIYSTFLQRGYDQVIHDVCLQNLPVIFCLDRSGLVGEDGPTHHGVFDLAYLRPIPNLTILTPSSLSDLRDMMVLAPSINSPVAIRYPKTSELKQVDTSDLSHPADLAPRTIKTGGDGVILAVGEMVKHSLDAAHLLKEKGIQLTVVDMRCVKPLAQEFIEGLANEHGHIFTIEDGVISGGFGSAVTELIAQSNRLCRVDRLGIPDAFVAHGTRSELFKELQLDANGIAHQVAQIIQP